MLEKKDKPTVNQHIVPQVYLNNFGTKNRKSECQIIVLGKHKRIKDRIDIVKNVGYTKNFYTVDGETDKEKRPGKHFMPRQLSLYIRVGLTI